MAKSQKLIIGNWKMNPATLAEAKEIFLGIRKTARELSRVRTVICPPFVYLWDLNKLFYRERMALGAQNMSAETDGPFTGEISGAILKNSGVRYVILGHSERRAMGETDESINKKVLRAAKEGLITVLCVGEKERDGHGHYFDFIKMQLRGCLARLQKKDLRNVVVAYEPVWAIGKSDKDAMQPHQIHEMVIQIRKVLSDMFDHASAANVLVLYGGSVTPRISEAILREGRVNGMLIGRTSLDAKDLSLILKQANAL